MILFIFGCSGSSLPGAGFSLLAVSRGDSSCGAWAFFIAVASRVAEQGPKALGFSSCSSWALEHRLSSCAAWQMGSSRIRDRTRVSCIGRWILYHWAIREGQRLDS